MLVYYTCKKDQRGDRGLISIKCGYSRRIASAADRHNSESAAGRFPIWVPTFPKHIHAETSFKTNNLECTKVCSQGLKNHNTHCDIWWMSTRDENKSGITTR